MDRTAGERKSNSRKTRPEIVTGTGPIYGQLRAPVTGASHILGTETPVLTGSALWRSGSGASQRLMPKLRLASLVRQRHPEGGSGKARPWLVLPRSSCRHETGSRLARLVRLRSHPASKAVATRTRSFLPMCLRRSQAILVLSGRERGESARRSAGWTQPSRGGGTGGRLHSGAKR